MTFSMRRIAAYSVLSLSLTMVGCASNPPEPSAPPVAFNLPPGERTSPELDAKSAASLQRIQKYGNSPTETVRLINAAREVTLNNIANAQTQAFKSSRAIFDANGQLHIDADLTQGSLEKTDNPLDVGIQGNGFISVKLSDNQGGTGYARAGNLTIDKQGDLILAVGDGYTLVPPITVPTDAMNISIAKDGTVQYTKPGAKATTAGQIKLATFANPRGLNLVGASLYAATTESGPAVMNIPGDNGTGQLISGYLESSNVDLTHERMRLQSLTDWRTALLRSVGIND